MTIEIDPIHFPEPRIRTAVVPPSKADMEKLIKALHQIAEEDPTLVVEQSATLKQTIIHGQGQLHLDLIRYRIEKLYGVHMDFERPRIPYRETITKSANEVYRHKNKVAVRVNLLKCTCVSNHIMKVCQIQKVLM